MFRSLSVEFVRVLNELYESGTWWAKLVNTPGVFMAIRNDYLNAYSGGMSIARVVWDEKRKRVSLKVHEEYLTLASGSDRYVDLLGGSERSRPLVRDAEEYVKRFEAIQKRATLFSGLERQGTNEAACRISEVIDMEAAFTGLHVDDELDPVARTSRPGRLDLVSVAADSRIAVCEAKLFSNNDLRSDSTPKVCSQLQEYHDWLNSHKARLIDSYQQVIKQHSALEGHFFNQHFKSGRLAPLRLDPIPRLWIFGHDRNQKNHAERIADQVADQVAITGFTRSHVIVVGKPSSLNATHLL